MITRARPRVVVAGDDIELICLNRVDARAHMGAGTDVTEAIDAALEAPTVQAPV